MIKIKDLYVCYETMYLRNKLKLKEREIIQIIKQCLIHSGLSFFSYVIYFETKFAINVDIFLFTCDIFYKISCPINVDNWDDFLIKNNPDYWQIYNKSNWNF